MIQVLTKGGELLEQQFAAIARDGWTAGRTLKEICGDLYAHARRLGLDATIGVQEVFSTGMPSFPGQTVMSSLVMVDVRPSGAAGGYQQRASA